MPASMIQHAHAAPLSPSFTGNIPSLDSAGIPIRHPRPLTAAELHLELEKEQEAVVNRLTRELSALRAHSASVASTASSVTSGVHVDHDIIGSTHPTSARRHRSSSSVSRTSASASYGVPLNPVTATNHRYSVSSQNAASDPSAAQQARSASVVSTPRYEEVAHYRQELEEAKRENEVLKRRIRELERAIRGGDAADMQRGRTGAPTSAVTASGTRATSATAEAAS
jgi:anti-sigma28 factor (negative regulator of flagellin synthesis)